MLTVLAAHCLFIARTVQWIRVCTAAHSTMDTHCTAHNLKEIPAEKILSFRKFLRAMPKPYNITDGDFVVGNITECSPVSWGLK